MGALTGAESFELEQCERQLDLHKRSWIEAGKALEQIRRKRLYRGQFKTFEAYCQKRWGMTRAYTDRLINASSSAQILGILTPMGGISERSIRPLTSLDPDDQRAAWSEALSTAPRDSEGRPKLTAKIVAAAVEKVRPAADEAEPQAPSNVIKLRRHVAVTLTLGKPEQAVQKLLAEADERDILEFYSELGWTLHRLGKITGWIEVLQQWADEKKEAAQ